jgi:hypothetical protein
MSSNIDYKTIVITIVFSVILSTGIIMTVPQVQDVLRGPQGELGLQGVQGPQGDTGDVGPEGPIGSPGQGWGELIYDSGWIAINQSEGRVLCTLDDPNVFVYMIGRSWWGDKNYGEEVGVIHQDSFGGDHYYLWNWTTWTPTWTPRGARWYISPSLFDSEIYELGIYRNKEDIRWREVRVLVWQLSS